MFKKHNYIKTIHKRFYSININNNNDYLQNTIIPTYHFQKSLLRLPIPNLEDTVTRYLAAIEPITTKDQFNQTKDSIEKEFVPKESIGQELQKQLLEYDKTLIHSSYINQWWFDLYVSDRRPLPININPQIRLKDDAIPLKNKQDQRAASLIASSVRFYRTLRDLRLEPDIFHTKSHLTKDNNNTSSFFNKFCSILPEKFAFYGAALCGAYPLDMSQYINLFASTRIPKHNKDILYKNYKEKETKHIIVQYYSDFYKIQVLKDNGEMVPEEEILSNIQTILSTPPPTTDSSKDEELGAFTTLNRDEWADARDDLINVSEGNKASLQDIDNALFMVCLEHSKPVDTVELSQCFLYGDTQYFNRWFDKSFQLIISANGKAAVNFEHSWGDGVAVLRYLNEMYQDSASRPVLSTSRKTDIKSKIQKLSFTFNPVIKNKIKKAKEEFRNWTKKLFIESAETSVTKLIGPKHKLGNDGIMQMSIQLAYYKLTNKFVSTYESASTSAFKHGRTETIRSCTNESVDFVKHWMDKNVNNTTKIEYLKNAIKKHNELTKNGVMGQGCDRHLFGLKKIAEMNGVKDIPSLYSLDSYQIFNKIILSTSTLSSKYLEGGSFGPVNDECMAVGYGIEEEGSLFQLASYHKNITDFKVLLKESLEEIEKELIIAETTK